MIFNERMSFLPHIEAIISGMLGFIKRVSKVFHDPYTHKTLYTCVWSPHQSVHSERLERVQHNFIRYGLRQLPWRVWPLSAYDARCLLIGLGVLSDRRIVASALFARVILVCRVNCADLALCSPI
jgi:hypothetical protein